MRRDRGRRDLPDDLALLGLYLEVATGKSVRRRARRHTMANFIGAVSVAVPFALAVAAADLSPADGLLPRPPVISLEAAPTTNAFMVRQVRDEPPPRKEVCLHARDCTAPFHPTVQPAPSGRR
jgi:hypothetical protein